jgi:hypothetical protein
MHQVRIALLALLPAAVVHAADPAPAGAPALQAPGVDITTVPSGFYRDQQGRVMQVSFDLQRRLWLGASYAPRQQPGGRSELGPVAFDFGRAEEWYGFDGRTRHRLAVLDGEARINPFALDVTAVRYDLSHAFDFPLLRITTLWRQPARHDLTLDVGLYGEIGRMQIEPAIEGGNHQLTLASLQPTLDLWQSWDLRSYLRLRIGPVAHLRFGPWSADGGHAVTSLPETALEGRFLLGRRALQEARFRVRGAWLHKLAWSPVPLERDWLIDGEASYEIVLLAINDQPISLRFAGRVGTRDPGPALAPGAASDSRLEWSASGGLRISFFSPPTVRSPRR